MYFSYSQLKNEKITVFRYGEPGEMDGLVTAGTISKLEIAGSVQPVQDLRNLKQTFGEDIQAGIRVFSEPGRDDANRLRIEEEKSGVRADVIYHDSRFWKVVQSIVHRLILPSAQSQALLMTHAPEELAALV